MISKTSGPRPIRLLVWNTFLLPGIRAGHGRELFGSRDRAARATEIGHQLAPNYDIAALCEVWDDRDLTRMAKAWDSTRHPVQIIEGPSGPGRLLRRGSGLATIIDGPIVKRHLAVAFAAQEPRWHGIDGWQQKGILCCEIELPNGQGTIELISTHNSIGGWFDAGPNNQRSRAVRAAEFAQLAQVIDTFHRDPATVLVVGDLNVVADSTEYDELCEMLRGVGLIDWWTEFGSGSGPTYGHWTNPQCAARDPSNSDFCAEPALARSSATRIDYIFGPPPSALKALQPLVLRRRPFPRVGARAQSSLNRPHQRFLSDHIALHLEIGSLK